MLHVKIIIYLLLPYKRYQAAERGFTTHELPGEAANPETLVKYLVDHATSILGMKDAVGEHIVVHKLQVFLWPDLFQRLAQFLSTFGGEIGAALSNERIYRGGHRNGIGGKP